MNSGSLAKLNARQITQAPEVELEEVEKLLINVQCKFCMIVSSFKKYFLLEYHDKNDKVNKNINLRNFFQKNFAFLPISAILIDVA